ncbi:MAG: arabinose operon transcriptional regulator AraC [Candidatus Methylacidiphilales bacterium]
MDDVLLHLVAAAPYERVSAPTYSWNNRTRNPPGVIVQYTWTGEGTLERNGHLFSCPAGHALLMLHGEPTRYFFQGNASNPWVFAWINFTGAERLAEHWVQTHGNVLRLAEEGDTVALLRVLTRCYAAKTFFDRYHMAELLARFLSAFGRELASGGTTSRHRPELIRDYLQDHHRRPLSLKEVASQFHLSREHLAREFRQAFGEPPGSFVRRLRMTTAKALLQGTHLPLGEVARQSGFGGQAQFCRAFRMETGFSPAEFRAQKSPRALSRGPKKETKRFSSGPPPRPSPPRSTML